MIFLVDDDALFLKSLEIEFAQNTESDIKTFATGEQCMENLRKSGYSNFGLLSE